MTVHRQRWDGAEWVGGAQPGTPGSSRDDLVAGTYIPGVEANTAGVYPGTTFADVFPSSGTTIVLSSGVYTGQRFFGNVKLTGSGTYTFDNCLFAGHDPSETPSESYEGFMWNYDQNRTVVLTDCTFDGWEWNRVYGKVQTVTRTVAGGTVDMKGWVVSMAYKGRNATFNRCELVNMQDGIFVIGPNVSFIQSVSWQNQYMNGGVGTSSDGATHCDAIQFGYGANTEIAYSMLGGRRIMDSYLANPPTDIEGEDAYNACLMIQLEVGGESVEADIHDNWFGGGSATVNMALKNGDILDQVLLTDNRFLRRGATVETNGYRNDNDRDLVGNGGYYIIRPTSTAPTFTRNVIWDLNGDILGTGESVPITDG